MARSRDAGNSMLSMEFPGGILVLTGANSATGLRSMPARYIFLDEVDAYPASEDEEGDPVTLAKARATIGNWSMPKAIDGVKGGPGQSYGLGENNGCQRRRHNGKRRWPTTKWTGCAARSTAGASRSCRRKRCNGRRQQRRTGRARARPASPGADSKSRMDILHYRAEQGFTRPDPAISPDGPRSSPHAPISRPLWDSMIASHGRVVSRRILKGRSRRRLDPLFVR